jgi:hypothetical protein
VGDLPPRKLPLSLLFMVNVKSILQAAMELAKMGQMTAEKPRD